MAYQPVTHYDPFKPTFDPYGEDSSEKGYCGTYLSIDFDNSTNDKKHVDCKKCIKLFEKAEKEMNYHSENFSNDCELFLKYVNH